jgi:hypothetical protein
MAKKLELACVEGDVKAVVSILTADPSQVSKVVDGLSLLHLASSVPVVEALLEGGADPLWRDSLGRPALLFAAEKAPLEIVLCLARATGRAVREPLESPCLADAMGRTVSHWAAQRRLGGILSGWTLEGVSHEVSEWVLGAVHGRTTSGETAIHWACKAALGGAPPAACAEIVSHLVSLGCPLAARSHDGQTARDLVMAAHSPSAALLKVLDGTTGAAASSSSALATTAAGGGEVRVSMKLMGGKKKQGGALSVNLRAPKRPHPDKTE